MQESSNWPNCETCDHRHADHAERSNHEGCWPCGIEDCSCQGYNSHCLVPPRRLMSLLLELEYVFSKYRLGELEVAIKNPITKEAPGYFGVTVRYNGVTFEANASKGEKALADLAKHLQKQQKASGVMHSAFFEKVATVSSSSGTRWTPHDA